jgi:hypothetical protein
MTQNNSSIEIRQVSNGFIVHPGRDFSRDNQLFAVDDTSVFQSMKELLSFIETHFDHREGHIEGDVV